VKGEWIKTSPYNRRNTRSSLEVIATFTISGKNRKPAVAGENCLTVGHLEIFWLLEEWELNRMTTPWKKKISSDINSKVLWKNKKGTSLPTAIHHNSHDQDPEDGDWRDVSRSVLRHLGSRCVLLHTRCAGVRVILTAENEYYVRSTWEVYWQLTEFHVYVNIIILNLLIYCFNVVTEKVKALLL